ncbi:Fc.00g076600.m01.CDS01 [Cosmosporella sp. VM-42]
MDSDLTPLDHRDRAASSEPTTTRPNPFDDTDISSRKRRRTSTSKSPATSLDIVNPIRDSSSSSTLEGDTAGSHNSEAIKLDKEPVTPQTPEHLCSSEDSPIEQPSSRVTLNLRHVPPSETMSSSPASPSAVPKEESFISSADEVKTSVEDTEVEMVPPPAQTVDTPQSSSSSESPPIELVSIQSDDEMAFTDISIIGQDRALVDPLRQFPYRDAEETLLATLHRLIVYLANQENIDDNVLDNFQQWQERYLQFINEVDPQAARESYRVNQEFWQTYPEIISATLSRRFPLLRTPGLHGVTLNFYFGFAKLSAWFVSCDLLTIQELASTQQQQRRPDLFSYAYLHQLSGLLRPRFFVNQPTELDMPSPRADEAFHILNEFQRSYGGNLNTLAQLAQEFIGILPRFPKLVNQLAPICEISVAIMNESARIIATGQQRSIFNAKQRLEAGHKLHDRIQDTLTTMIEKHVTHLSSDNVNCCIHALAEMLKASLQGEHQSASAMVLDYRQTYPNLTHKFAIDAIAWEQKFNVLVKLIRSSQMQLRVMAVTSMCNELVTCYKRHGEAGDDPSATYLNHLGIYLLNSELIEYILGPNCHPEIIVESGNIIGFLVVTKLYQDQHTDLLWQGIASSQDPRVAEAVTRMVSSIANLFDLSILRSFCGKFQALPIEAYTPAIRNLWVNVMDQIANKSMFEHNRADFQPYSLCLRLLRDATILVSASQVTHPDMHVASLNRLKTLLNPAPDPEIREQLYSSCINDIALKSTTTLGSLWCLSLAVRLAVAPEIHLLTERHNFTKLIVDELEHAIEAGRNANVPVVLSGLPNRPRRDIIANILQFEPLTIDPEQGKTLWDILVGPRSPCLDDRKVGWCLLINAMKDGPENPFLRTCLSEYLPALPSACFCEGMLDFLRHQVLPRVNDAGGLVLDEDETVAGSGIEQLWRLILEASDGVLVDKSVHTLAVDVYINSRQILTNPLHRTRQIHLALVNRCLHQLKEAARRIKASSNGTTSGDDEPMALVTAEDQMQEQDRIFTRSLMLLRYFLEAHQRMPHFAAPDLRTLISNTPYEIEGESAGLKFQSFNGKDQSGVTTLSIGKLNTAASLLESLRQATGFENYRMWYRGREFVPKGPQINRSLEELDVQDGLILVQRQEDNAPPTDGIRPGATPLEVEISAHFDEMWEYLSMDERHAQEIYAFLVKLPTDGHVLKAVDNDATSYKDIFPPGQPFKSLYAVHALAEGTKGFPKNGDLTNRPLPFEPLPYTHAVRRSMSLIVQAISNEDVFNRASAGLRLKLTNALISAFLLYLNAIDRPRCSFKMEDMVTPAPKRLVEFLGNAIACSDDVAFSLFAQTLATILHISLLDGQFWKSLSEDTSFSSLLQRMLLFDTRVCIRQTATKSIEDVAIAEESMSTRMPLTRYFWKAVSDLMSSTVNAPTQCDEVFRLVHLILVRVNAKCPGVVDLHQLALMASEHLLDHTSTEEIGQVEGVDSVARGFTSVLNQCLTLDHTVATSGALPEDLAKDLFWKHLYPVKRTQSEQPVPRVLLDSETRRLLCDVIFKLVKSDKRQFQEMLYELDSLVPFYPEDEEANPYRYELPFNFERFKALRSPCGYVGLQNLSNTCYLNSLLTQLFMNTNFRRFIMNARTPDPGGEQQLLFYTQKLFGYMQDSYRRFADPTDVVTSIRTYDDTHIDIHNQMDVDEFYNLLLDRWEGQLVTSYEKRALRSFYGGQLVQQVKSKECPHVSERFEPFSAIQCDIKGKTTLEESLQAYVDGEIMEGDNKYKCSTCDRHVDAVKRACLKDIPDNVIFHLKRFDFNLRTLERNKINDYFAFPALLNLQPYKSEYLADPASNSEEDIFELVGVLVHSGTAESGHYYSYIRERPTSANRNSWVEFNDDMVSPWDPAKMESATFGGADHRSPYENNGMVYSKAYSAYMLFYQRASSLKAEQQSMSVASTPAPLRVEVSEDLREAILDENTILLRRHCLFDPSHTQLVQKMVYEAKNIVEKDSHPPEDMDVLHTSFARSSAGSSASQLENLDLKALAMRTAVSHFDQVVTRAKDIPDFLDFSRMIDNAIAWDATWAYVFYDYFNKRRGVFRALVQRNSDVRVRRITSTLFVQALEKISVDLRHLYAPEGSRRPSLSVDEDGDSVSRGSRMDLDESVIEGTMLILEHLWRFFQSHLKSWDEYFGTVLGFARLGHREVVSVLEHNYLLRTLRIVQADLSVDLPQNYSRMLHNVLRRMSTRPPSYQAILALQNYLMGYLVPVLGPEVIVEDPRERVADDMGRYSWSSDEVQLIHYSLEDDGTSLFVEKLLSIDQNHDVTDDLLRKLIGTGPPMDIRVFGTLKNLIKGDTSTQAMDPFLRGAGVYIECTLQVHLVTEMAEHLCIQASHLQSSEGGAFLDFFKKALSLKRSDIPFALAVRECSLRLLPKWTPALLVYHDRLVRLQAHECLQQELFTVEYSNADDQSVDQEEKELVHQVIKDLGVSCLQYLRRHYINRRRHLGTAMQNTILNVVDECGKAYETNPETQGEADAEFFALQVEILSLLQRLTVDEIEEDGSDWDGSASSGQIDDIVEMSFRRMHDETGL